MQPPDPIEAALFRLMPPALSEAGRESIEAMIDELAGEAPVEVAAKTAARFPRWLLSTGIAAAAVAMAAFYPTPEETEIIAANTPAPEVTPYGMVLVSQSDRIENMIDEGWQDDPDGSAMHAVRIRVIEEDSLRDEETGIVVQVSVPREEVLLMPVSAF